ncbi:hypothetical protein CWE15_09625 [Aliidiomarina taiwanensis]|uniref:Mce/MlaD domain-containing protein n=1 Tax=Aliidiomarina taiwanensis TaxID=946228 RepID=A0A432X0B0_9GAMM|nr:MlaD family protein [Aliidiomarina taiwanensis]RUO39372.1 hypothetical protein CWE15_09625 [Aliidiomarina taiwanensis]
MTHPTKKPHYIHRMSYSAQEKLVGVFVIVALALLVGLFTLNASNLHLFENYKHIELHVQNAEDITLDTPVLSSGIQIGRVDQVKVTPENSISIRVRIYESYTHMVRTDSTPKLRLSLLGRSSIEFSTGTMSYPEIEDGAVLVVDTPMSMDDLMAQVRPVLSNLEQTIAHVSDIVAAIEPNDVAKTVHHLSNLTGEVSLMAQKINAGEGSLGQLLNNPEFATQLADLLGTTGNVLNSVDRRLSELAPLLTGMAPTVNELSNAAPQLGELFNQTVTMLEQVNQALAAIQPETQQLPDLMIRVNLLTEQANRLLNQMSQSWLFSGGKKDSEQQVELVPHE